MIEPEFQYLDTNGVSLRTVVRGEGPLVILLHGFPQCWYLWRHQIDPLVAAGYRVAVPDQRGYGGSSCPPAVGDYDIRTLCADVVGLAAALGESTFNLIGHDWGCIVAWNTALLHPDNCRAVMGLSVPNWRIGSKSVDPPGTEGRFWYIRYFQQADGPEAALEADIERSLYTLYYGASGDAPPGSFFSQLEHPADTPPLDAFPAPPAELPAWLTRSDLDYYTAQFRRSGFRGPINWYRNMPTNNDITPELDGARFRQPAAFAAGALDLGIQFDEAWAEKLARDFDDLRFIETVADAGHWLQLEQPEATTALLLRFLEEVNNP